MLHLSKLRHINYLSEFGDISNFINNNIFCNICVRVLPENLNLLNGWTDR